MAKMTVARAKRWDTDLKKAAELISRTQRDVGDAKLTTTGGPNQRVIAVGASLAFTQTQIGDARGATQGLVAGLERAAAERKEAAARKAAEKAQV